MNPYTDIQKWKNKHQHVQEENDKAEYLPFAKKVSDKIVAIENFKMGDISETAIDVSAGKDNQLHSNCISTGSIRGIVYWASFSSCFSYKKSLLSKQLVIKKNNIPVAAI